MIAIDRRCTVDVDPGYRPENLMKSFCDTAGMAISSELISAGLPNIVARSPNSLELATSLRKLLSATPGLQPVDLLGALARNDGLERSLITVSNQLTDGETLTKTTLVQRLIEAGHRISFTHERTDTHDGFGAI